MTVRCLQVVLIAFVLMLFSGRQGRCRRDREPRLLRHPYLQRDVGAHGEDTREWEGKGDRS